MAMVAVVSTSSRQGLLGWWKAFPVSVNEKDDGWLDDLDRSAFLTHRRATDDTASYSIYVSMKSLSARGDSSACKGSAAFKNSAAKTGTH